MFYVHTFIEYVSYYVNNHSCIPFFFTVVFFCAYKFIQINLWVLKCIQFHTVNESMLNLCIRFILFKHPFPNTTFISFSTLYFYKWVKTIMTIIPYFMYAYVKISYSFHTQLTQLFFFSWTIIHLTLLLWLTFIIMVTFDIRIILVAMTIVFPCPTSHFVYFNISFLYLSQPI
jgi:hypothetical protein